VLAPIGAEPLGMLTRVKSRLENSDSIILWSKVHQYVSIPFEKQCLCIHDVLCWHSSREVHLNAPSTCAKALSFRHYQDRGIEVWRACSRVPKMQECPRLQERQVSALWKFKSICYLRSLAGSLLTPVDNPHVGRLFVR
jgi:hypothetical protein